MRSLPPASALQRVQTVLATGKPLVSDLIVGPVTKRLVTTVYVAAATQPAGLRHVVAQAYSVEHWKKVTLVPQGRDDWVVAVLDRSGKFISRSRRADALLGQPARPELAAAAASASEGLIRHRTLEGVDVYDAFAHSATTGWTIAVAAPVDSIEASATQAAVSLALGLLVALVAGAVSGTYLGRALLGAVAGASSSARSLADGRVPPPATSSITELNTLQQSLTDAGRILAAERSGRTLAEDERTELLVSEREARELAERQNAAKDCFLAMLGHELRNPLAAISGATEVLVRRGPAADDRRFVDIVQRQNRHLSRIVDDLLDTSRMLSGKVALKLRPVDLGAIVRESAEAMRASHVPAVDLVVEAAEVWIDADAVRIEQTFNNLVGNAIKFSPSGAPVRIEVRAEGDRALLVVADRGPGIAPSLLPNIFEPFVQGPTAPGRMPSGLGIGLALVKQIVGLHGGTVAVADNTDGPGCTFTVTFARIARPETGVVEAVSDGRGHGRVLLVEDNDDARDALAALLQSQGFEVVEARDGDEALAAALAHRPDVVVMDLDMPGKSGLEVAREIRAHDVVGRAAARRPQRARAAERQGRDAPRRIRRAPREAGVAGGARGGHRGCARRVGNARAGRLAHGREHLRQHLQVDGLLQVVVDAPEGVRHARVLVAPAGDGDQDQVVAVALAQAPRELAAVHAGQVHVEQDAVRLVLLDHRQGDEAVVHDAHVVAVHLQDLAEDFGDVVVIVDDQDADRVIVVGRRAGRGGFFVGSHVSPRIPACRSRSGAVAAWKEPTTSRKHPHGSARLPDAEPRAARRPNGSRHRRLRRPRPALRAGARGARREGRPRGPAHRARPRGGRRAWCRRRAGPATCAPTRWT